MQTIALIAPTGMIGSGVYNVLKEKCHLILVYRDEAKLALLNTIYGGVGEHRKVQFDLLELYQDYCEGFSSLTGSRAQHFLKTVGAVDGVINCSGITKAYSAKEPSATIFLNAVFPHLLSQWYGPQLIHITTDCVFNGFAGGPSDERSLKNPNDLYGLSKSLGEPTEHSLVLRTSTIGNELAEFVGLLTWFKAQQGKTIKGFTNHLWNGITNYEYGRVCHEILSNRSTYPATGLFHIFSTDISKYDMLCKFKVKYNLDIKIDPVVTEPPVDRRLCTIYEVCKKLSIHSFDDMLTMI